MSATERAKGARYERELVLDLKAAGFEAERTSNGRFQAKRGDLATNLPAIHIEAKRCENVALPRWLKQAQEDAPEGHVPVVVYRRSGEPSRAVVPWVHYVGLLARIRQLEGTLDV